MRRRQLLLLGALAVPAIGSAYSLTGADWAWQANPVEVAFSINTDSFPASAGTSTELATAYQGALSAWSTSGAQVNMAYGGTTTATTSTDNGSNLAHWVASISDPASVAIATTWFYDTDIYDCDIEFYGQNGSGVIDWSSDSAGAPAGQIDFQVVATHELGHCLGLGHSADGGAVMYPSTLDGTGAAERILDADDVAGAKALYGTASPDLFVSQNGGFDLDGGDGDYLAEPGELIQLRMDLTNGGGTTAYNVVATVTTNSTQFTLTDSVVELGDIAAGTAAGLWNAFEGEVSADCSLDEDAVFTVSITADGGTWSDSFIEELYCAVDDDLDGYNSNFDCDDSNAAIHPDAEELCDDADNDCDGAIDEEDATDAPSWYIDADEDGYGVTPVSDCNQPAGTAALSADCDDTDPAIHPGADEACGDEDLDCDGETQECASVAEAGGCGCNSKAASSGVFLIGLLPLLRRRRSPPR